MADKGVRDWIDALSLNDAQALEERVVVTDVAGSFEMGSMTFLEFIQDLEPYVGEDQTDLLMVSRGMSLFSIMLKTMQGDSMTRQDTQLISEYLRARLENEAGISNFKYGLNEVADCLIKITNWKRFVPGEAGLLVKAIFKLAQGPTPVFVNQTPHTRRKYYEIIAHLSKRFLPQLQRDVGASEFVTELVELGAREKSAVCLRAVFALYGDISIDWNLGPAEYTQLWESFMRYFPITLTVTPNDQPKPEELRELLLRCITANDFYANEGFEKFLRELDIDQSANTKKQILIAIKACVKAFSIPTLTTWASKIWDSLKFEIWNGENEEFIEDSLDIVHSLVAHLTNSDWSWVEKSEVSSFVDGIVAEIFERLSDMKRFISGSERMLNSIASASPLSLHLVIKGVFPGLCIMAQDDHSKVSKKSIVGMFNSILQARVLLAADADTYEERYNLDPVGFVFSPTGRFDQEAKLLADMQPFHESIKDLYFDAISELKSGSSDVQSMADVVAQGLVYLAQIVGLLGTASGLVLETLNEVALAESSSADLQRAALKAIRDISTFDSNGFVQVTVLRFLGQLPDEIEDPTNSSGALDRAMDILENLVQIACTSAVNHYNFHKFLLTKFDAVRQYKGQLQYLNLILAASQRALSLFDSGLPTDARDTAILSPDDRISGPYSSIVFPLLDRIVGVVGDSGFSYIGLQNSVDPTQPWNDITVHLLGQMLTIAMLAEYTQLVEGSMVCQKIDNILVSHDKKLLPDAPSGLVTLFRSQDDLKSVNSDSQMDFKSWGGDKSLTMFLIVSLLVGINPKDRFQMPLALNIGQYASKMLQASMSTSIHASPLAKISFLYFLQLLVNKFSAGTQRASPESPTTFEVLLSILHAASERTSEEVENIYRTLSYYTSASLLAFHREPTEKLLGRMIEGIAIPEHGLKIAQSFRILIGPSPVLTKKHFCNVRPLHQSFLFSRGVLELIGLWRETQDTEVKGNYLVALAGILGYIDTTHLVDNVSSIFPAILEGTNSTDSWSQESFIKVIHTLIPLCSDTIEEHLDSVIARMTGRIHGDKNASVRCRAMALEVLTLLVKHVDAGKLVSRKFKVVGEIDVALDDMRREVRHKAEVCKMVWFNLKG